MEYNLYTQKLVNRTWTKEFLLKGIDPVIPEIVQKQSASVPDMQYEILLGGI